VPEILIRYGDAMDEGQIAYWARSTIAGKAQADLLGQGFWG
jgi:hypothetical protein